jgi:hypothetical protein
MWKRPCSAAEGRALLTVIGFMVIGETFPAGARLSAGTDRGPDQPAPARA